ncbi:MAG: 2-oxoglutarate dehydrogenase complex dihydrolipoyllysine-residue succinyltransferase [Bacteroidales bacterium]|nr:2-oxoglutarate dehydrogenase complex dihydrolipoyllysine-residue succinyltransferase [Bacteroidales bacterium]
MIIEIKVPSPGESISEVQLASWLVKDGDFVEKDAEIAEVDSDKATLTINAAEEGIIKIMVEAGETIKVGSVVAQIDSSAAKPVRSEPAVTKTPETGKPEVAPAAKPAETVTPARQENQINAEEANLHISPLARKLMQEKGISGKDIVEYFSNLRISKADVEEVAANKGKTSPTPSVSVAKQSEAGTRNTERKKMSTLRLKLAQRLVSVKNETAMLTTFNEVNMSRIMEVRKKYNDKFKEKYGISVGFMSFFTKAITIALKHYPAVNAMIDGDEMVFHDYADIGIAVSAPKGLVVPVVRNAEILSLAQIELAIKELAVKARDNKITLEDMTGGTFTITNGGVFGSMMSTPILNPPQSAILGMHNIIERPIAVNGQVVIAPMMYVALSYDHRVIDGRESVSFLVKVKELLENPEKMLFDGMDPVQALLEV